MTFLYGHLVQSNVVCFLYAEITVRFVHVICLSVCICYIHVPVCLKCLQHVIGLDYHAFKYALIFGSLQLDL